MPMTVHPIMAAFGDVRLACGAVAKCVGEMSIVVGRFRTDVPMSRAAVVPTVAGWRPGRRTRWRRADTRVWSERADRYPGPRWRLPLRPLGYSALCVIRLLLQLLPGRPRSGRFRASREGGRLDTLVSESRLLPGKLGRDAGTQ